MIEKYNRCQCYQKECFGVSLYFVERWKFILVDNIINDVITTFWIIWRYGMNKIGYSRVFRWNVHVEKMVDLQFFTTWPPWLLNSPTSFIISVTSTVLTSFQTWDFSITSWEWGILGSYLCLRVITRVKCFSKLMKNILCVMNLFFL